MRYVHTHHCPFYSLDKVGSYLIENVASNDLLPIVSPSILKLGETIGDNQANKFYYYNLRL